MISKGLQKSALSVSAVAFFISNLLKNQLGPLLIKGEISGLRKGVKASYLYFSLIDDKAKIECLTHISSNGAKVLQQLQDGDEIIVFAQPNFYAAGGKLSFFTDQVLKLGEGLFVSAYEKLKQSLSDEGLFKEELKKKLPLYSEKIGVVTSADGAVLQDIIRVAKDRWPMVEISVFPALVQGEKAPESLRTALLQALSTSLDAVIIGRGGGSVEDLSAFNDEALVRLIHSAKIPIISAIGHETDLCLCDFAADYSAPTPTGAAMKLFPDKNEVLKDVKNISQHLRSIRLNSLKSMHYHISTLGETLRLNRERYLSNKKNELLKLRLKLEESHPKKILGRGYALLLDEEGCKVTRFYENQKIIAVTSRHTLDITVNQVRKTT